MNSYSHFWRRLSSPNGHDVGRTPSPRGALSSALAGLLECPGGTGSPAQAESLPHSSVRRRGPLRPTLRRQPRIHPIHRDASLHRTHQPAQIAPDALLLIHLRNARGGRAGRVHRHHRRCLREPRAARGQKLFRRASALNMDALVRTVPAGDVTKVASDTKLRMNARHDLIIQIQVLPLSHTRQTKSAKVVERVKSLLVHPVTQALDHVFHDAVTVMHHCRTHLHAVTT